MVTHHHHIGLDQGHPDRSMMHGGYYGYRRGYYDPWMGYGYGTTTQVSQYTEGTINIDLVDMAQKRMVWEGARELTLMPGSIHCGSGQSQDRTRECRTPAQVAGKPSHF